MTAFRIAFAVVSTVLLTVGGYVVSIVWRVSVQEQKQFGRSDLIPLSLTPPKYKQEPTPQSFAQKTYQFNRDGHSIIVWRQKLNGFQHMFGSALAAYELGDFMSDKLFCANEFTEYLLDWDGIGTGDLMDRKKDLRNNALGRKIGVLAKEKGLNGSDAETYISKLCADALETDPNVLSHCLDSHVFTLTQDELGCSGLPTKNLFDLLLNRDNGSGYQ